MIKRKMESLIFSPEWGRQIRFIVGPRQSGKTTLAQSFLQSVDCEKLYYNWDRKMNRIRYRSDPDFFVSDIEKAGEGSKMPWVCFDELHKQPKWKNMLKGWFDAHEKEMRFLVTGSAMLGQRKRVGDSLAGRFLSFHLFPFSLQEAKGNVEPWQPPPQEAVPWIESRLSTASPPQELLDSLLNLSGFPEPFIKGRESFRLRWQDAYTDLVVKEDIRDLTQIHDITNLVILMNLLPDTVGNPLSANALREDLEYVHYQTVKNYLSALAGTYVIFELSPYSKRIRRAVKKEKKIYFFDWTRAKNEAARFENYAAFELFCLIQGWNDAGYGRFRLNYVRQATGRETDFLIVRDEKPWLLIEAKLHDQPIERHHYLHAEQLGHIPLIQICLNPSVLVKGKRNKDYRVSASRFFS